MPTPYGVFWWSGDGGDGARICMQTLPIQVRFSPSSVGRHGQAVDTIVKTVCTLFKRMCGRCSHTSAVACRNKN